MTSQKIPPDNSTGEPEEAFFDDPEKWTDEGTPRHAPVPARVFQKRSLLIDEALLSRIDSPRAPRIRSHLDRDRVIRIGRRALEVAIMEAFSQTELNPRLSEWEPEWSRIADASRAADVAYPDYSGQSIRLAKMPSILSGSSGSRAATVGLGHRRP